NFLDPGKPLGTHYGSIIGLQSIGGAEVIRELVLPNLDSYDVLLKEALSEEGVRKVEANKVVEAVLAVLGVLSKDWLPSTTAPLKDEEMSDELKSKLTEKLGDVVAGRIIEAGKTRLAQAILNVRSS
ncbi:hypothetical protein KEM55_001448, partial [Ascosphaera atra]